MKQVVPPEDRKVIDTVIGREQLHLKQLIDFMQLKVFKQGKCKGFLMAKQVKGL